MKQLLVLLLTLGVSVDASAQSRRVHLMDILTPSTKNADFALLASDGQVYALAAHKKELIELAYIGLTDGLELKLKLSEAVETEDLLSKQNEILGIKLISQKLKHKIESERVFKNDQLKADILMSSYISDIDSIEKLQAYFKSMRRKMRRGSECFNRAYVWSWEMSFNKINGQRVHMGKTWLFFTRKYIREYDYKWWFHVAPYMTLNKELRVMDRSFLKEPAKLQDWTDEFIYNKEECKLVAKYSDYREHQQERNCFVILSSVHYWQPLDIEKAETEGLAQKEWSEYRLGRAYKNAVGIFAKPPERD